MIDVHNQPDLDAVLNALSASEETIKETKNVNPVKLTDDEYYAYLMSKLKETIDTNSEVLDQTKDLVSQVGTAEYVEAHASVVKSQSDLLKNMVGVIVEKQKLSQAKELKTRDLDIKEKSIGAKTNPLELTNGASQGGNTFILATRDQVFDKFFGSDEEKDKADKKIKEANGIVIDV